jgi:hypothetical protein
LDVSLDLNFSNNPEPEKPNTMMTKNYLISAFLCFMINNLGAAEIFVSPNGNDRNPGTKEHPLASLAGARDAIRSMRAGGTTTGTIEVHIARGQYLMNEPMVLTADDSGSAGKPVIYRGDPESPPVFIGGIVITGWEQLSGKLWKTHVGEVTRYGLYFEQLYINGKRAVRAKTPNNGFYFLAGVDETIIDQGTGRAPAFAVQKLTLFQDDADMLDKLTKDDMNDALMVMYHKWDNTRKRIASYDAGSSVIYTAGTGMKPWNRLDLQTRYTLENYKAALDTCGEWFLERNGTLWYIPLEGETIQDIQAIAPVTDKLIVIQGEDGSGKTVEHIRFEHLKFTGTGYRTPLWGNEAAQAAAPVEAVIMADRARNIHFLNCEISHTGSNAFWFRNACSDCSVVQCYLHDLGAGGIKIGPLSIPETPGDITRNIKIDNNIIRSGGYVFPCAVGVIIFHGSDNEIIHNEIADFRYSGISVGWVWGYTYSPSKRNKIEFNHIHHLGWGELCDMGGVYCLGQSEGTTVSNNVIHHVYSFSYGGWGLYTDEGSTGIVMENNLVYACKNSGFHQHYGRENTIRNNILAANIKAQLQGTRVEEHLSFSFINNILWYNSGTLFSSNWAGMKIISDSNCYWDTRTTDIRFGKMSFREWQEAGNDRNSIIQDPGFVNPEKYDFRLKNNRVTGKIGFKPFDYTRAGVYGDAGWIKLAVFAPDRASLYDHTVEALENRTQQ